MAEVENDAIRAVILRNDFYRDNYKKLLLGLLLAVLLCIFLGGTLIYIVTHPPAPKYFATTTEGRITPLISLDQPNLSTAALLQWANTAAVAVYNYNFINYRQAFQEAANYFTEDGWKEFMNALKSSNNLDAVIEKKLIVSGVATGAPIILDQLPVNGVYTWKVQMPMLVTYQSASQFSQQSVVITLLIVRVATISTAKGIGVAQFIVGTQDNNAVK